MKRSNGLFLLALITSLTVGCSHSKKEKGSEPSKEIEQLIEEARSLSFQEKCIAGLEQVEDLTFDELYSRAINNFIGYAVSSKAVAINYNCDYETINNNYVEKTSTAFNNYYLSNFISSETSETNVSGDLNGGKTRTKTINRTSDVYYNTEKKALVSCSNGQSGLYANAYDYSQKDDEYIQGIIRNEYIGTLLEEFSNKYDEGSVYKDGNNYVLYGEYQNTGYVHTVGDVSVTDNDRLQIIINLDAEFNMTKCVYFMEEENNLGVNDIITKNFNPVLKVQYIAYFTYGEKKSNSQRIEQIEKDFAKPFFTDGQLVVDSSNVFISEDYKYVITAPNKMHLETVITFDELATEPVELVLKSYGSGSMGLYKTDYLYLDAIDSHFDIKDTTGALSSGEGDKINYNMSDINACLLFTAEVSLNEERTEMVFNIGTVEIKSIDELE